MSPEDQQASDICWMQQAILQAQQAVMQNEVPVGAVLVLNNEIIGVGCNQSISGCDPTAHAEIMALRDGAKNIGNYRLLEATLYVTLEPCMMCVGAMVHARIKRLVYGAYDLKTGVVESRGALLESPFLNHFIHFEGGVMKEACGQMLSEFFQARRKKKLD